MGWKYKAGLFLIATVVFIWVTSAEVTQKIFADYKQPFALTYLGASLMVIYLPIAAIKQWICHTINKCSSKRRDPESVDMSSVGVDSPLKYDMVTKSLELELPNALTKKDSGLDLSAQEEGNLLIPRHRENLDIMGQNQELTDREIARYSFYLAPVWFVTEYLSNAALARTSVASTTVLSSTSGLFTLFFGVFLKQDSINVAKVVAVFVSMAGVVMTTLGKTWATDESQTSAAGNTKRSLIGDLFGLLSAVTYGLFTGQILSSSAIVL
ncbi:unnamed protein product [Victoria cruziana]